MSTSPIRPVQRETAGAVPLAPTAPVAWTGRRIATMEKLDVEALRRFCDGSA
jgi:hypothetical protein